MVQDGGIRASCRLRGPGDVLTSQNLQPQRADVPRAHIHRGVSISGTAGESARMPDEGYPTAICSMPKTNTLPARVPIAHRKGYDWYYRGSGTVRFLKILCRSIIPRRGCGTSSCSGERVTPQLRK